MDDKKLKEKSSLSRDNSSMCSLYNKIMQGFEEKRVEIQVDSTQNEIIKKLYAPGFEEMGVGDIVAQCK